MLDEVEKSIVGVVGDSGAGNGSVVASGRVLTNWHVVDGERTLAVVSAHTGGEQRARLIESFQVLDPFTTQAISPGDEVQLGAMGVLSVQRVRS